MRKGCSMFQEESRQLRLAAGEEVELRDRSSKGRDVFDPCEGVSFCDLREVRQLPFAA